MRGFIEEGGVFDEFCPVACRMNVDFEDAGVGRDAKMGQTGVERRFISFDDHRQVQLCSRRLDRREQFEVLFQCRGGGHENVQPTFTRFGTHRKTHHVGRRGEGFGGRGIDRSRGLHALPLVLQSGV